MADGCDPEAPNCLESEFEFEVVATTKPGSDVLDIGHAAVNAAGDRIVFSAETADGTRYFVWDGSDVSELQAVTDLLAGLPDGPEDEVHLGDFTMSRSGSTLAFITQVNTDFRQVWTLDLDDGGAAPQQVTIDDPDADIALLGQLTMNGAGELSMWQFTCEGSSCVHELLESIDPGISASTLVAGAPNVALLSPVRAIDGSTLYLQHDGLVFSLRRTGVAQPLYTTTNSKSELGLISGVVVNDAATPQGALYLNDPLGAANTPGIYMFDLDSNTVDAGDLAVALDGSEQDGFTLTPAIDVRPAINIDGDAAFSAKHVDLELALVRLDGVLNVVLSAGTLIDDGNVIGDIDVLGVTDQESGGLEVLFRAAVEDGADEWSVLGLATLVTTHPADLNGDNQIGVADLLALLSAWGTCTDPQDCPADLDDDGSVGVSDLLILLAAWGPVP